MQAGRERYMLPQGGEAPVDMVFRVEPPAAIGDVLVAWTNNGPDGPRPAPLSLRLGSVWLGAMGGFVLGLVGFFVIGGIFKIESGKATADAFLLSLAGGLLLGVLVGVVRMRRPPQVLTLFFGAEGCVQIERVGAGAREHLLDFREVEAMRTHVSTMTASGIRTTLREIHMRPRGAKERLWYVTAAPGQQKPDDPQYDFGEAVLAAFAAHQVRRGDPVEIAGAKPAP